MGLLGAVTGFLFAVYVVTRPLGWVWPRAGVRTQLWVTRNWGRRCLRILGGRLVVEGSPPQAPFFLVCNHLSYVDILAVIGSADCVILSKADVADWPVIGFLAKATGTLFIERERRRDIPKAIAAVEGALAQGLGVTVFPEGTSTKGEEVTRFRASLFQVAVRTGLPVACATITYRTEPPAGPAHQVICWWGDMEFGSHAWALLRSPSFHVRLVFGDERIVNPDRKELAREAHAAVSARFDPVVAKEPA